MKLKVLVWACLLVCGELNSQSLSWSWARGASSTGDELSRGVSCDIYSGNIYTAGSFNGDLSAFFGSSFLSTFGKSDGFVAKYSSIGNFMWAIKIGGNENDEINSVCTDPSGNIYVAGYFGQTVDFDPSLNVYNLTSSGGNDGFLAKYDANGTFLWAVKIGGVSDDEVKKIYADQNQLYITGSYISSATFYSTSSATKNTTASLAKKNWFGGKYNQNGVVQWAASGGSSEDDIGFSVVADNNNVYFIGDYRGTFTLYPASGSSTKTLSCQGNKSDVMIASFGQSGSINWLTNVSSNEDDEGRGISQDDTSIYIAGSINETAKFPNPSPLFTKNHQGGEDVFIARLKKATGVFEWVSFETGSDSGDEGAYDVKKQENGNVFITGYYKNFLDFSQEGGPFLNSKGNEDIFVTAFDPSDGKFIWVQEAGGNGEDEAYSITLDTTGAVFISGTHKDVPTLGTYTLIDNGGKNVLVAKLGCAPLTDNNVGNTQTICAGDTPALLNGSSPSGGSWIFTYLWEESPDNTNWMAASGSNTAQDYAPPALFSTTYYRRKVISSGNCYEYSYSTPVPITVMPLPAPPFAGNDFQTCGDTAQLPGSAPQYGTGQWSLIAGSGSIVSVSSATTPVNGLAPGTNTFRWTVNEDVCGSFYDELTITRDLPPTIASAGNDQNTHMPVINLTANTPSVGTGQWSLVSGYGNILSPSTNVTDITGLQPGQNIFRWNVRNGVCPASSDDIMVNVDPLVIPSGFTPNSDNINDSFEIPGIEFYPNARISVYNRWGGLVYENEHYKNEWRGLNKNNEELADDTYYYTLHVTQELDFKGFVLIKRSK